ncbi:MAG: hypothetical protein HOA86_02450 [Gammaproteobacteria bacterium]|jgi:pyridoxamine 5'-phosphate oxidase|nr:hypothetical protein [Gammaproteobacteria bacterium]MBT3684477.1 hypothetical protein [Cryomorphaceae bacterium]MBT6754860.1 hypothetical protein [Gammaproteobacteria bacterium]MBT7814298.1 hypothetical protein [Gammaproteobacteria bacterium]
MNKEETILDQIWDELEASLEVGGHPFHIFSISTIFNNKPDSRNVVLRNVNRNNKSVTFHTDTRSNKISQIKNDNNVCALFYDSAKKIQIRAYGSISIETDELLIKDRWKQSKKMSKLCYLHKSAPGKKIDNAKDYLYDEDDLQDIEVGIKNFSVINIKFNKIDWLNLSHKGHERIIINFTNGDNIKFEWVAP